MKLKPVAQACAFAVVAALSSGAHAVAIHDAGLFSTVLPPNDDDSTGQVNLGFAININGTTYTQTYINNNGNITFDNALPIYTPAAITNGNFGPIIAPFFGDVDTSATGMPVTYGSAVLGGKHVFGVDYINVGVYSQQNILNSFQLILTDRSDVAAGDFDIQFNYDKIHWESGTNSGAPPGGLGGTSALAGYWTSSTSRNTLPGSLVNGALVDGGPNALVSNSLNSAIPGQFNFEVRGGVVVSTVPEPETYALMLAGLGVVGFMGARRKNV